MDAIILFFTQYGLPLTLIAVAGVIILGVMKYCNLFSKLEETQRHLVYIAISVGLSVVGSIIYLLCIGQFEFSYVIGITVAIYALNQAWYNIFKATTLNDLIVEILNKIIEFFKRKSKEE